MTIVDQQQLWEGNIHHLQKLSTEWKKIKQIKYVSLIDDNDNEIPMTMMTTMMTIRTTPSITLTTIYWIKSHSNAYYTSTGVASVEAVVSLINTRKSIGQIWRTNIICTPYNNFWPLYIIKRSIYIWFLLLGIQTPWLIFGWGEEVPNWQSNNHLKLSNISINLSHGEKQNNRAHRSTNI